MEGTYLPNFWVGRYCTLPSLWDYIERQDIEDIEVLSVGNLFQSSKMWRQFFCIFCSNAIAIPY